MGCKVVGQNNKDIHVSKLRCGEPAVITCWHNNDLQHMAGKVVQRVGNDLIVFGEWEGESYSLEDLNLLPCKARRLHVGDTIRIEEIVVEGE